MTVLLDCTKPTSKPEPLHAALAGNLMVQLALSALEHLPESEQRIVRRLASVAYLEGRAAGITAAIKAQAAAGGAL